jgi:hypothetical protein
MNTEIEKLINAAIIDGELTDKEKRVILKKANDLGIDRDEVEIYLESKVFELNQVSSNKLNEKAGDITKCPACGASVKPMSISCEECGHEFQNKKANKSITDLFKKLEKEKYERYRAKIISNFPIPQTKEDIFEFLTYSFPFLENSNVDNSNNHENEAWRIKVGQTMAKAKLISKNPNEERIIEEYEKKFESIMRKAKTDQRVSNMLEPFKIIFILGFLYLLFSFIAVFWGYRFWPINLIVE